MSRSVWLLLSAALAVCEGPPHALDRTWGEEIVVRWKSLPSGRQFTLSCAYRTQPPALVYRDAVERLPEVVAVEPVPDGGRTP